MLAYRASVPRFLDNCNLSNLLNTENKLQAIKLLIWLREQLTGVSLETPLTYFKQIYLRLQFTRLFYIERKRR